MDVWFSRRFFVLPPIPAPRSPPHMPYHRLELPPWQENSGAGMQHNNKRTENTAHENLFSARLAKPILEQGRERLLARNSPKSCRPELPWFLTMPPAEYFFWHFSAWPLRSWLRPAMAVLTAYHVSLEIPGLDPTVGKDRMWLKSKWNRKLPHSPQVSTTAHYTQFTFCSWCPLPGKSGCHAEGTHSCLKFNL